FESCRDHNKKAQSLRNQSVAFLFVFGGFLEVDVICVLIFVRSFCFLVSFFVAQRLMVFPISISAMS
ncbi:MAG: hypothetical protein IJG42_10090, partial [Muribaculaceae bacterium]|nr:hypothetical protein [Muribaculaceae bacterium]